MIQRILFLLLFFGSTAFAQSVRIDIDTLQVPKGEAYKGIASDELRYPIIRTGKKDIDSIINYDMKNRFTEQESPESSIDSTLINWADGNVIYLDFTVTYNRHGILSLNISAEGCGAYCTSWTSYYNYSTITGKPLELTDIFVTTANFKKRVLADKSKQFVQQRKELKDMLSDKSAGLDQESYTWALESYAECEKTIDWDAFALYPTQIQMIEDCYLPNAIKNLTPVIELKYKFAKLKERLKIKL